MKPGLGSAGLGALELPLSSSADSDGMGFHGNQAELGPLHGNSGADDCFTPRENGVILVKIVQF